MAEVIDSRQRGQAALKVVLGARGGEVPYEAIAELIELSRGHESVLGDVLAELLGQTESDDVAEAAIPTLTRFVLEGYDDIKGALDASRVQDQHPPLARATHGGILGSQRPRGRPGGAACA